MKITAALLVYFVGFQIQITGAQTLTFDKKLHDFGTFNEVDGPQTYRFEFTNTSKEEVEIEDVKAYCGCTTPSWTKGKIKPGQRGFVDAQYDPRRRPGKFSKTLAIVTDSDEDDIVIAIKGLVEPKPIPLIEQYSVNFDGLRVKDENLYLGRLSPKKGEIQKEFKIYNASGGSVEFLDPKPIQEYFDLYINPIQVEDKGFATLTVQYDAAKKNDYGSHTDFFTIETKSGKRMNLELSALLEDEPVALTDQEYALRPRLEFDDATRDFGAVEQGKAVKVEFTFKNSGKETLEIYKTQATCGCTAGKPSKTILAPGEKSTIHVTFNSEGKDQGRQSQAVTIYSNDPVKPTQKIMISGEVTEPKQ